MTRKRAVKLLMAHGCSRNEAVRFMRRKRAGVSNLMRFYQCCFRLSALRTLPEARKIPDSEEVTRCIASIADSFQLMADACASMRNSIPAIVEAFLRVGGACRP